MNAPSSAPQASFSSSYSGKDLSVAGGRRCCSRSSVRRRSDSSSNRSLFHRRRGSRPPRFSCFFISSPTRIARTAFDMFFVTGAIWKDLGWSSLEFTLGVALAFIIGIPLGLAPGWFRRFNYAGEPFITALNATPQVAFLPLLILWVGTGLVSRVLIVVLLAVLPIAISALAAVRTVDARLVRVARSFSAGDALLFRSIVLPSAAPFLLAGFRLAVGCGRIGIVAR